MPQRARQVLVVIVCVMVTVASGLMYISGRIPFLQPRFPDSPSPGFEVSSAPLASPVAAVGEGPFVVAEFQDNGVSPVTWDACRPIHYVINPANMPPGAEDRVHEAVEEISAASGYVFIFDGYSSEPFQPQREVYQPEFYGDQWAPVLVSFVSESEANMLAGDVVGYGGGTSVGNPWRPAFFVTGRVIMDAETMEKVIRHDEENSTRKAYAAILHEFGHVMGLDHVDDPTQLMYPTDAIFHSGLQPGDLNGLRALNPGQCAPWL